MFSKRKKLIISGCSYTDNYAKHQKMEEFPIWGELLAEKLDMDLINLGRSGYGNGAIYHTLIEEILNRKDIGLVVAMWSEVQRVCFFTDEKPFHRRNGDVYKKDWECFHPERIVLDADWHDKFFIPPTKNTKKLGLKYDISVALRNKFLDDIKGGVKESLGYMYAFQTISESNNLSYLQIQGCQPLMGKTEPLQGIQYKELCKLIIESSYIDKMKKTFIGWPIDPRIGGYSIDSKLEDKHRFSPEDTHPNDMGHKYISEVFYDEYEKIYP
jgi:hypothetical protein